MKKLVLILSGIWCALLAYASGGYRQDGNALWLNALGGEVRLDFCTDDMFRVRQSRSGALRIADETWMVRKYDFAPVSYTVSEEADKWDIETGRLRVEVWKNPFRLVVRNKQGEMLYAEQAKPRFVGDSVCTSALMQGDEHFFGFGERMDFMDQRGHKVYLNVELGRGSKPAVGGKDILRANYCPVPFMMSTAGYGIFFHTAYPTEWDMGWSDPGSYSFKATGGELDYYFIYGPDFYTMLDRYTDLTGKSPMLPRFAMGLHLGTYSGGTWKNEQMTSDAYPPALCKRMRQEGIPFDLLWLDSTWRMFNETFGNGGCTFEWRETFKDPKAMFDSCYAQHVQMVGLHVRSILDNGPEYRLLDEARKKGNVLYPGAQAEGLVNFFSLDAVDWWWENGVKKVADLGCKFVKTDVGSAFRLKEDASGEGAALHNLFPLAYAEAPYRKFKELNGMRGLTHTREGYAGIQRYPYIWAGDWGTEWQWFEPVIRGGLNIGMSGVGSWTHCMGGFEQYSAYDTELYMRWVQFGMFSPIAMLFGMDHPRYHEPWTYGEEAMRNFIKYDKLRYRLIPYIYTNAWRLHRTARPMMSALVMDYPQDENTYHLSRQYMFGPWMMVCPVTTKNALSQWVYFPGGKWFDYETGERYEGRQYKSFLTPLDVLPVYIKAGAIIPMQPEMQWVGEKPLDVLTLDVYPEGESSFEMYEDDGISLDYEKGMYALTRFTSSLKPGEWTFRASKPEGKFRPERHQYAVQAYLDFIPSMVLENGKSLERLASSDAVEHQTGWFYDSEKKRLFVKLDGDNRSEVEVVVR